ncbi:MAG: hypothetical protein JRF37_10670 [Deltaproteobacteria bacterium]|nr:hypothetical protein [Deltaproteobacteria bacterium]
MIVFGQFSRFLKLLFTLGVVILLFSSGCGEDVDTKLIDFSDTVATPQPSETEMYGPLATIGKFSTILDDI